MGWSLISGTTCKPTNLPSTDYFFSTTDLNQRPVCGTDVFGNGRVPVLPSFEPLPISTSTIPNSNKNFLADGTYFGVPTTKSSTDSTYLYDTLTRCACMFGAGPVPLATLPNLDETNRFIGGNYPAGYTRMYPDTYDVISTQNQSGSVRYNLVAYADDKNIDGRLGVNFQDPNVSRCGCPNINEVPVQNHAPVPGEIVGWHCEPKLSSAYGRILTTYEPSAHGNSSIVLNGVMGAQVHEPTDESVAGVGVASSILIPTAAGGTQLYDRKLWTCAPPYITDFDGVKACIPPTNMMNHACSDGGGVEALVSPVSSSVSGMNAIDRFHNTLNKKLACCMNESINAGVTGAFIKFDCVDNSVEAASHNNFNTLWTSADLPTDGGQSNAMVLAGPLGKYLTGFYTLDGVKCEEYSEFAEPYTPARVKKDANGVWVKAEETGPTINPPGAFSTIFSTKSVPKLGPDMKRCPIVARAAFIASCPENPELPVVPKTYVSGTSKHCSSAASIQVHVRIEQIFEIEGMPKMKTVDTVAEQRLASSISVEKIIIGKSSNCPGGATKRGDVCVYQ
jgi:hypothetical protein